MGSPAITIYRSRDTQKL